MLVTYRQAGIGADFAQVRLVNLATKDVKTLTTEGYDARLTPAGSLVFGRSGRVFAARFDPERQTVGDPVPIASDVRMHALYPHLQLAVSDNAAGVRARRRRGRGLDSRGSAGRVRPSSCRSSRVFTGCSISPTTVGVLRFRWGIRRTSSCSMTSSADRPVGCPRPTAPGGRNGRPNGEMLAYTSFAEGKPYRVMVQRVDSDRPPVSVAESSTRLTPSTWSPDGRRLTFYEYPANRLGAVSVPLDGAAPLPPQFLSFAASTHDLSPDGGGLSTRSGHQRAGAAGGRAGPEDL